VPVVFIEREDKLVEIARKRMFADNSGVADLTTEDILQGFHKLEGRQEIKKLNQMFRDYIAGKEADEERP